MQLSRRKLITGLISLAAAPAIVRVESLMPVKVMKPLLTVEDYLNLIMKPMLDKLEQQIADAVIYGSSYSEITGVNIKSIECGELLVETVNINDYYARTTS